MASADHCAPGYSRSRSTNEPSVRAARYQGEPMSEQPTKETEVVRLWLKNSSQHVDITLEKGMFPTWANRVKNDGMMWNDDVAIPYDSIFMMARVAAFQGGVTLPTMTMAGGGRMN